MIIVNLYGGPGTGKSTVAAQLFSILKWRGVRAELVTEYAKDLTYEQRNPWPHQLHVFAEQHHRLWRLDGQVDVVVTDSPLLLSLAYSSYEHHFHSLVVHEYWRWPNRDFFLTREAPYATYGRTQTEAEAVALDQKVRRILDEEAGAYEVVPGNEQAAALIAESVLLTLATMTLDMRHVVQNV